MTTPTCSWGETTTRCCLMGTAGLEVEGERPSKRSTELACGRMPGGGPLAGLRTPVAEHLPCPSQRVCCAAARGNQTWKEHFPECWMPSRKLCTEGKEADRKECKHDNPIT